jgi:hypothetical protein
MASLSSAGFRLNAMECMICFLIVAQTEFIMRGLPAKEQ